jgi:hypothetical protein
MLTRRLLLSIATIAVSVSSQEAITARDFAGEWQATFKDKIFMVLKLKTGSSISGTLSGGSVSVNAQGDIIQAERGGKELPISNARMDDGKLRFEWEDEDGETAKLEMKVVGHDEAELQFSNLPDGAKMKPIRLRKV